MKLIILTLFFIVIIFWQTRPLIKNREWKELIVYSCLMLLGIIYSYAIILDLSLPNPTTLLTEVFKPIYEYIFNVLLV